MIRRLAWLALPAAAAGAAWFAWAPPSGDGGAAAPTVRSQPAAQPPTLYCEFYNFVGRTPKVGFTFTMRPDATAPVFAQVNQIEADGSRTAFGAEAPPPVWGFDGSDSPAVLTAPDGAIRINLYAYDAARRGTTWFEAGLRSVQYLNLDGKCRQSFG